MSKKQFTVRAAYIAWFSAALFYFYQYILRVSPGVMVTDLRQEFHMTAEQFSSLGAYYLYAYSLLQIPLGFIIDRIGVRRTVLGSIVICVAGALVLKGANELWAVKISRLLVGAGSAAAFMSALKIAADWLPLGKRGFLMGATLTLGTIGALFAGKPLVTFVDSFGWRTTIFLCALLGLCCFAFSWLFLRVPTKNITQPTTPSRRALFVEITGILRTRSVMIYAVLAVGLYTPLSVLADLWGTAFLMQKYALSRANAAQLSMMMYVGLSIGSLFLPWLSEKYNVLNGAIKWCSFGILISFSLILFGPNFDTVGLGMVLLLLGVFCGAEMMCFTGAVRYATSENSGLILGVVNTLNMLGGAVLQQAIGYALDSRWKGQVDIYGVRIYSPEEFMMALMILLAVVGVCCLISFRLENPPKNSH